MGILRKDSDLNMGILRKDSDLNMGMRIRDISLAILGLLVVFSCNSKRSQFELLPAEVTGVEFNNTITEYDTFNILTYEYIYNGGGVAIADFNNDGLQDIYFTGNMVSNALYLNRGNLKFKNVTDESGVTGEGRWSSGVAVVDINGDGWQDIYVCATTYPDSEKRRNILYINQGAGASGTPIFSDMSAAYNLNDTSYTTHAAFFDYDNDGDLDVFLINNKMTDGKVANVFKTREQILERVDKLFRNDWDETKNHPVFTDVSAEAGIVFDGYSLGLNVTDINQDGWNDIYVANDYLSNDLVYINQRDGTFNELSKQYLKHSSHSSMGTDVTDINNDGLPDIIVVDMLPEDNYRKKTMLGPNNYATYINNEKYGFQYQYIRNTLQLNQGRDPRSGNLVFSEIGFLAGISSTDWSWTPLVADFDNDGYRDVIITNGFPRDVTDRDFVEYHAQAQSYASPAFLMNYIPSVKIKNYAFRNTGGFVFEDVSDQWGISSPSFSNGAAYADLDNDGDLDYVVNNINDRAFVFENQASQKKGDKNNWLRIMLKGKKNNLNAFGAKVRLYHSGGKMIYAEQSVYRGYLSSVEPYLHFGLGKVNSVDSVVVEWPGNTISVVKGLDVNKLIELDITDSKPGSRNAGADAPLFDEASELFSSYVHKESDFIDFNIQPLLLHKLSQYGPGIAVGDVNGDGLEDLYISGSRGHKGTFFVQDRSGRFEAKDLFHTTSDPGIEEELGVLFFDADNDGDSDLYVVSGGYEADISDKCYVDALYENRNGVFHRTANALPKILASGSCVRAADFDRDGDLDLFVGGRVLPHKYPVAVSSYILQNDSKPGELKFTEVNDTKAPQLNDLGLVCDALWSDFNGDGWVDLVVGGEWAPLYFFVNRNGVLEDVTENSGVSDKRGLWNSIAGADFDGDGDVDYVVGNLGLNTLVKGSAEEPFQLYYGDFDKNGNLDFIPTSFVKNTDGGRSEFPFFGRLDTQKELIQTKRKFLKHAAYGKATIADVLSEDQLLNAKVQKGNYFQSALFRNSGNGKFSIEALPQEAQISIVNGIITGDFNSDGHTDILAVGNDYGTELLMGRMDALNGLTLLNDGSGKFRSQLPSQSGLTVSGDAKALVSIITNEGHPMVVASQNRGTLRAFKGSIMCDTVIHAGADIAQVQIDFPNHSKNSELYYGQGFLSQSSRVICVPKEAVRITLIDYRGRKNIIPLTK